MLDGSQWGKFLRLRTEAIATVLVGCAESDDFRRKVLRASTVPEASAEYATCRQLAVVTLCQAINQLDRYSRSTANRVVSGLTRIAAACREDIHPIANELMEPLLPAMLDGSQWGKFLRLRTEAIATVLVGCAESDDFRVENHPWISDFISFLLDPVVSSESQ
ncbi:uncharacterized protein PITG_01345 [Phytophthora infestans T30-4]|uniref:Uncharacterized protein n=1 Tax=Phytophthora infestans (strain T30-4) TaxID=403677 RepID=D0MVA2_PHYIT|nr:uncharacterized protein PITG_01345 [Phytophthora infestans T30-4]EEY61098.1 conserved hypothetical protein [Phytophthora infestans T30-4]|eukprot:XP_002908015.1 conserved hypothetical protein [Phytophthora infestans T30-4]